MNLSNLLPDLQKFQNRIVSLGLLSGGTIEGLLVQSYINKKNRRTLLIDNEIGTTEVAIDEIVSFRVIPFAYVTNEGGVVGDISVINTSTNTVIGSPIPVGSRPDGIAITPDCTRAYVTNFNDDSVSVINTSTNTVIGSSIPVGSNPFGIAITPDGTRAYVTNRGDNTVLVINTSTNTVIGSPILVGLGPSGIAITPDGTRAYVINQGENTVSVINTSANT